MGLPGYWTPWLQASCCMLGKRFSCLTRQHERPNMGSSCKAFGTNFISSLLRALAAALADLLPSRAVKRVMTAAESVQPAQQGHLTSSDHLLPYGYDGALLE